MKDLKIKLAVLWLFWIVAFLVHMFLGLFEKGVIEKITEGEFAGMHITSYTMLFFAFFMLVPLLMAFMSLILKDRVNRWANMALGLIYTGLCFFDMIASVGTSALYHIPIYIYEIMSSALIVWYTWKWSKQ